MSLSSRTSLLFLSLIIPGIAAAQSPSPSGGSAPASPSADDVESARNHFKRASRLFDLQRYDEAAREYEAAYERKDDPALLFNIGQAYRLAGDNVKAIGAYKSYLRRSSNPRNAAQIEQRIADLQKLVDEQRRNQAETPTGTEPVTESATATPAPATVSPLAATPPAHPADDKGARRRRLLGIGLIAGGGAAVVAGAVLTGLAYQIQSDQSHPRAGLAYDPAADSRMKAEQISGAVLLGVGAAAAVGGGVLYWLGRRGGHAERVSALPLVSPTLAGLAVTGVLP
jgi:tetratricopeptide (TPR) repeat protein